MKFVAFERAKQGTGASRRLRISGRTPGIVYQLGNRPVIDQVLTDYPWSPTPETRRELYRQMHDGETLISAVWGLGGLLYDGHYRYRVENRPASPWYYEFKAWDHLDHGTSEAPAWLAGLLRDHVDAAIVYTNSAEDKVLREPGSGYQCVYEQPARDEVRSIRIYRRAHS